MIVFNKGSIVFFVTLNKVANALAIVIVAVGIAIHLIGKCSSSPKFLRSVFWASFNIILEKSEILSYLNMQFPSPATSLMVKPTAASCSENFFQSFFQSSSYLSMPTGLDPGIHMNPIEKVCYVHHRFE
jgi:hypothetical protein